MSIKPHPLLVQSYYKLISYDKVRFLIVGGMGFVVNYLSLALFFDLLNLPILPSQIIGAEIALLSTFVGNNFWAFTHHHHISLRRKLVKFHVSALMGLLINSTFVISLVHYAHMYYGFALVIGSIAGLMWNYTLYKRFVFKPGKPGKAQEVDADEAFFYNLVKATPFIAPAAVVGFSVPAFMLLLLGQFRVLLILPLGLGGALVAAWVAATSSMGLKLPGSQKEQRTIGLVVILFVIGWMGFNAKYASQDIIVYRDPGIYADAGEWLRTHRSLDIPATNVFGSDPNILADSAGFSSTLQHPDKLYAQGAHLLPVLLGAAGRIGGTAFMLHINPVIGGLALLAFYGLSVCFVRPRWALFATVALGLSLPMIFFSRDTYSEPLSLLLSMGALALIWVAQAKPSYKMWLLAGLAAGAGTLSRADEYLVVAALAAFMMARLCFAPGGRRRATAVESLWFGLGAGFATLLGWLDLTRLSAAYYRDLRSQLVKEFLLIGLTLIIGIVATAVAWRTRLVEAFIKNTRQWYKPTVIVLAVLLSLFFLSRPLWYVGHSIPSGLVASLQSSTGHAVQPTRDYAEMAAYWVIWYIGPVLSFFAVVGMAMSALKLVDKRGGLSLLPPLLVVGGIALVYLTDPNISPDQIWASRRFLPEVFPGFCLFAMVAMEHSWQRYAIRLKGAARPALAALLVVIVILPSIYYIYPSLRVKTYGGELANVDKVCDALPAHAAVLLAGNDAFNMTQTITTFCNVPAMRVVSPTVADLQQAARSATAKGLNPVVMLRNHDKLALPDHSHLTIVSVIPFEELTRSLYHPPRSLSPMSITVLMSRLRPDGSLVFFY